MTPASTVAARGATAASLLLPLLLALGSCGGHDGGTATAGCGKSGTGTCEQGSPGDAATNDVGSSPADAATSDVSGPADARASVDLQDGSPARDASDAGTADAIPSLDALAADAPDGPPQDASADVASDATDAPVAPDAAPDLASDATDGGGTFTGFGPDYTMYLANPGHTNFVDDATLVPPLARLWTATLGQTVDYYPLIAGELVYVSLAISNSMPARVVALDKLTGSSVWSATLPDATDAYLAYENGRVFAVEVASASLWAFDAKTGTVAWHVQTDPSHPSHRTPPVVQDGTLYILGDGGDGLPVLYAYDEAGGALRWMSPFEKGEFAASSDGIFTFDACGNTTAVNLDGSPKWTPTSDGGSCYPAGTSVIFEHTLYQAPERVPSARVDTRTGNDGGAFTTGHVTPVFGAGLELDAAGQSLQATSTATGASAWKFASEGPFAAPVLVVGRTVYAASAIGTLAAVDAATGHLLWSDNVGAPLTGQSIAAGGGVLVAAIDGTLVTYGPGTGTDGGVHDYGGKPGCAWSLAHGPRPGGVANPTSMAIADFDKDGKPDLVLGSTGDFGGGGLNVLLGKGDGTFEQLAETMSFYDGTSLLAAGDVDGDGFADLVSASGNDAFDGNPNVKVSLGKGDGTFKAGSTYGVAMGPVTLTLADLDGDGRPDLIVGDYMKGARVLLNQGKGTFASPVAYGGDNQVAAVAVGDVNGDGKADLLLGLADPPVVQVLPGKGNGTFGAPLTIMLDGPASALALADVNGDGKLDLAAAVGDVAILLGKGDGTFTAGAVVPAARGASGLALGDMDLDGRLDLVVTDAQPGALRVFFGAGDGQFDGRAAYALSDFPALPLIADFNRDGLPDVAASVSLDDTASLLLGACATGP